jgi:branched-chain amino acid transport system substrate-binding protein
MRSVRFALAAACAATALAVTACGSDDNSTGTSAASGTAATTTAAGSGSAPASASGITEETKAFVAQYTGITPGKVDPALEPIKIGYLNQEGGAPSFPEDTKAANAVINFLNKDMGGIGGHALKLEKCVLQTEEDGQKCGAQLLEAKVPIAEYALAVVASAAYHKTVGTKFPTVIGTPSAPTDSTADATYVLGGGGAAVLSGMADYAKNQLHAKYTSVVTVDNPGGKFSAEKIAIPYMDKIGLVHSKSVYYPESATTPDVLSALQAAGASKADAIILDPSGPQQCGAVFEAIKSLQLKAKVIGTPICNADEFVDTTGAGPEGWVIVGYGVNPRVKDDPQAKVFNNIMESYGAKAETTRGFTPQVVRDFLSIAKFAQAIGPDKLTPEAFTEQIKAFKGPAFMIPGELHCGRPTVKETPTYCGDSAGLSGFVNGKWVTLPDFTLVP